MSAIESSTTDIGRVRKMVASPCEITSDWRSDASIGRPSTKASTAGASG